MATAKKLPSGNYRTLAWIKSEKRYASFTAPTKKESEFKADLYSLKHSRPEASTLTVGDAIDRYIASKDAVLSPKTIREYKGIRKNALQSLMSVKVSDLTDEVVQSSINAHSSTHKPKTVRNAAGLLSAALSQAAPDLRLRITLPRADRREITIPDHDGIRRLLAETQGSEMYTAILLAASLGL